jgi:hypothetical protein
MTNIHLENPSDLHHTLHTVSGICLLNSILIGADVDVVLNVVANGCLATIREGSKDVLEQSQLERMLMPAIDRF